MLETTGKNRHGSIIVLLALGYLLVSPINELLPLSLNRIVTILFMLERLYDTCFVQKRVKMFWIYSMAYWISSSLFAFISGPRFGETLADTIYMLNLFLVVDLLLNRNRTNEIIAYAKANRKRILSVVAITEIIIAISALSPYNYEPNGALRGWMYNSHSMASTAIFAASLVVLCIELNHHRLNKIISIETVEMLIAVVIVLAAKSRTFLIPMAILFWRYLMLLPIKKKQRGLLAIVFFAAGLYILREPIMAKFKEALDNPYAKNTLAAVTNFRSELWKCDLTYFKEESLLHKFFGNGFSFVRQLHEDRLHARLWSHNDITYLLISNGLLGLLSYGLLYSKCIKALCKKKADFLYISAIVFFPMLVNGFYIYGAMVWSFMIVGLMLLSKAQDVA